MTTAALAQEQPSRSANDHPSTQEAQGSDPGTVADRLSVYEIQSLKISRDANGIAGRAAGATIRQADYAFWQVILGGLAALFTATAAAAAIAAAVYAKRAADAARDGIEHARKSANAAQAQLDSVKVAERAYLATPSILSATADDKLGIRAVNLGRTRAHVLKVHYTTSDRIRSGPGLRGVLLLAKESDIVIGEGAGDLLITTEPVSPHAKHLVGFIVFEDVYHARRRQHFRYDRNDSSQWLAAGGLAWNSPKDGDHRRSA